MEDMENSILNNPSKINKSMEAILTSIIEKTRHLEDEPEAAKDQVSIAAYIQSTIFSI